MLITRILTLVSLLISLNGVLAEERQFLPPEQAFKLSLGAVTTDAVELNFEVAPGYHLYRDKFKFESKTPAIEIAVKAMPEAVLDHDQVLGDVYVYRAGLLTIPLSVLNNSGQQHLSLFVKHQGCADQGVCYPPQKTTLDIDLPISKPLSKGVNSFFQSLKGLSSQLPSDELLPPEQAFQFFASVKDATHLHVSWIAAEGYYLYKSKLALAVEPSTVVLGALNLPQGILHDDPEYGKVEIYRQEVGVDVELQRSVSEAQSLQLSAKFQGCADRGVCYPPMQTKLDLQLPAISAANAVAITASAPQQSEQDQIVSALKHDSLFLTLLSFFGFGVLLSLTPCIFPMVPILSGIIVGQGHDISSRKGFLLSLSYVLASALMYTAFGVLAALFGSNLQAAFQEPWVIALFSAIFILLSLSMFDFYHLSMPQFIQARLHRSSDAHRDGSYLGAAIMGAFSSLIVGPCVAAPLAAALMYIGQTGDVLLGGSALFVMGFGMGLPLLILGASAGRLLPKAGNWLNTTKAVFGVIMLAVAWWMLSRILPLPVSMLLLAMLLIMPAVYLGAIEPLPDAATGWRKLWKGLGLIMLILGVLELIGLAAGNQDLLRPLQGLMSAKAEYKAHLQFKRIKSVAELDAELKQAAAEQKPVMLDFYADWCVSCKELEAYTFTDPAVQQQLAGYRLLQADVTENNADDKALLQRFKLIGPPGILFYGADGKEKETQRVIGFQEPKRFLQTLQQLK